MTTAQLLREVLKDPILKEKYKIPESELQNASFDSVSKYPIIETLKTIIQEKDRNTPDTNIYKSIKVNFGIE